MVSWIVWKKSEASNGVGECVEVGVCQNPDDVHVRDSKDPGGSALLFSRGEWDGFITGIIAAE